MQEYQLYNALRSYRKLQDQHLRFLENLRSSEIEPYQFGQILHTSENLIIICLGHEVTLRQKLIHLSNGELALEYNFIAMLQGEEIIVMNLFITQGGVIYKKPDLQDYFDDNFEKNLHNKIIKETFIHLLRSRIFAPLDQNITSGES